VVEIEVALARWVRKQQRGHRCDPRGVQAQLIELEAGQAIGAARYERATGRLTHRNGSRGRLWP